MGGLGPVERARSEGSENQCENTHDGHSLFLSCRRSDGFGASPRRRDEYVFDRQIEQLGNAKRQRERRVVFAGLDRVDALARNFEPFTEILLAPVALRAQEAKTVF